jgi:hypothetical protein
MSSQGNDGARIAIEEDQNGVFWSLLDDLYTEEACYGRLTVVSDLDVGGVVLNVDGGSRQDLGYIEVRTTEQRDKHTRGDDEVTGTLQSMPTSEREVQGLYKVCTGMDV